VTRRSRRALTRREWLQTGGAALAVAALPPTAAGQEPSGFVEAARCMRPLTGAELPPPLAEPVAGLVEVITQYSAPLRKLDLGEMEPATRFDARSGKQP